ncbi:MAG: hypothetical protein JWN04_3370 [Myxococcaceae bacterium]|nr:hypothetical protein [Myxococcaceae bacterium]
MLLSRLQNAFRQVHPLDWLFLILAALLAANTLSYPFGRDQGLYHYVGREWFLGALPYQDTMDQKTPIIYLVFGIANLLFGEHMWSVRLVELLWVLTIGWLLGVGSAPRGELPAAGMRGLGSFFVCILYFGILGYWDTAQCEIWYTGFCFLSLVAVERSARPRLGPLSAGFWGGLACLTKPPAVFVVLAVVFALATRELGRGERGELDALPARIKRAVLALAIFGAGAAIPTLITVLYFWARGGLADFYDVVVLCNTYYRGHESPAVEFTTPFASLRQWCAFTYPLSLFAQLSIVGGLVVALRQRSLALARRYTIALLFPLGGFAAVVLQGLYFPYHYSVLHVGWALALVFATQDLARHGPSLLAKPRPAFWFSAASAFVFTIGWTTAASPFGFNLSSDFFRHVGVSLAYNRGDIDEAAFDRSWDIPGFYDWSENRAVGKWLNEHSQPEDLVASRNFEPAIYAIAHRSSDLRFFWTAWLTMSKRAYHRELWLAQDAQQIKEHPPRFVVVFLHVHSGPDSIEYFQPYGTWVERMRGARLAVYERTGDVL